MRSESALLLRLIGPLIQVICLVLLFWPGSRGRTIAGVSAETLLYAGFALGFVVSLIGITLSRFQRQRPRL
jgi:hypothetical protein